VLFRSTPETIVGDPTRLRQVITNLLDNALKFTHKGFIGISLDWETIDKQTVRICIKIEDSGIGISDEKIETVFKRFTQADSSTTRKYGGTGLGLAIVREILVLMDGEISVQSKENVGTMFYITIPFKIKIEEETDYEKDNLERKITELRDLVKNKRVLIVEDNPINQKVAIKILEKINCSFDIAADGQLALEKVAKETYDLIFMDINMPILSGVETTIKMRAQNSSENYTPIVAMTANAMSGDREKYISAGLDDYITKPIKKEILYNTLHKWLNQQN